VIRLLKTIKSYFQNNISLVRLNNLVWMILWSESSVLLYYINMKGSKKVLVDPKTGKISLAKTSKNYNHCLNYPN
jgi:hypothetical protein